MQSQTKMTTIEVAHLAAAPRVYPCRPRIYIFCKERENSHGNSKHAWGSVRANVNVYCGHFQVDETSTVRFQLAERPSLQQSMFRYSARASTSYAYQLTKRNMNSAALIDGVLVHKVMMSVERSGLIKSRSAPATTRFGVLHCVRVRGLLPAGKLFVLLESTLTPLQVETRRFSDFTCVDVFPLSQQACR
jgi:hypothetical protein